MVRTKIFWGALILYRAYRDLPDPRPIGGGLGWAGMALPPQNHFIWCGQLAIITMTFDLPESALVESECSSVVELAS